MTTTTEVVAIRDEGFGPMIEKHRTSFAAVLPDHIKPEAWMRVTQALLRRDDKLAKAANANPLSLMRALLDCARQGLEPGDTYHLVPFGNEIVGIVDFRGDLDLMYRAGAVKAVKVEVVYDHDEFTWHPDVMSRPRHRPNWFTERGEMIGVYAYAEMNNGTISQVVVMNKAEVEKVRAVSKTASRSDSPWRLWPDRMWRKTAIHQLKRWVPTSAEFREQMLRGELAVADVVERIAPGVPLASDVPDDDEVAEAEIVCDVCREPFDDGHCTCDLAEQRGVHDEDNGRGDR